MRKPVLLIFINAMILLVVFALLTQSLVITQRLAVASALTGGVEVQRNGRGNFRAMGKGDFVKTGDVVRSSANGTAEFKWADGTRWKILPNTRLMVKKSTFNNVKRAEQSQLRLDAGKVFVRIMKELAPTSKFEIETPTAVAAVRGTIFSVQVKDGKTEVAVFKGAVDVRRSSDTGSTTIRPGQEAIADGTSLETQSDAQSQAEFQQQGSMVKPHLNVQVKPLDSGKVLLSGETEAGDVVTVNGKSVAVLGNGVFRKSLIPPQDGKFVVTSTDRHGIKSLITKSLTAAERAECVARQLQP